MLHISTPYRDYYTINSEGFISKEGVNPSGDWKLLGLMPVRCWQLYNMIPLRSITPEWIKTHDICYVNGNPRYTVVDVDHGTTRLWGNTKAHGIRSIWFD